MFGYRVQMFVSVFIISGTVIRDCYWKVPDEISVNERSINQKPDGVNQKAGHTGSSLFVCMPPSQCTHLQAVEFAAGRDKQRRQNGPQRRRGRGLPAKGLDQLGCHVQQRRVARLLG